MRLLLEPLTFGRVVGECARTGEQREALLRHAMLVERGSRDGIVETAGRQAVTARYRKVIAQLASSNESSMEPILGELEAAQRSDRAV